MTTQELIQTNQVSEKEIEEVKTILEKILKDQIIFSSLEFREYKEYKAFESKYFTFAIVRDNYFYPDSVSYNSINQSYQISCHNRSTK